MFRDGGSLRAKGGPWILCSIEDIRHSETNNMCYAANVTYFVADITHCLAYIKCGAAIIMCAQVPRQSSWCFEAFQCSKTNHEYFLLFSNPSLTQCSPIQCEAPNKKTEEDDIRCYSRHPDSLAS